MNSCLVILGLFFCSFMIAKQILPLEISILVGLHFSMLGSIGETLFKTRDKIVK